MLFRLPVTLIPFSRIRCRCQESDAVVPSTHAFVKKCLRTWRIAREALTQTGERNKASTDPHHAKPLLYVCGQKVWLSSKDINFRLPTRKLGPKLIGPFVVAKVLSLVMVRLKLTPQFNKIHPVFPVSKIKPVFRSPLQPLISAPPPPRLIEGSLAYSVRRLIDVRRRGRGYQYLVDWDGPEERCWIPARNILDCALIDQFHQRHGESSGDASWWEVLSRFRVPSWLPLLSCHFGSSWSGQSVPIVQQDHKLILSHLSLISPLPYMSLCSTPGCE